MKNEITNTEEAMQIVWHDIENGEIKRAEGNKQLKELHSKLKSLQRSAGLPCSKFIPFPADVKVSWL